jgi:formylglycine-generating enzyme required for sulfatase activity
MNLMPRFLYIKTVVLFALLCCVGICSTCHAEQYLFLVGVRDYSQTGELTDLKFAEDDVHTLADLFSKAGVPSDNIVIMTQRAAAASKSRFNPRSDLIMKELRLVLEELGPEDSIIVGFSGHGLQFKDDPTNYFCPMDANPDPEHKDTLVSLPEVYRMLTKSKAVTKLLLVDACRNDPLSATARAARRIEIEPAYSRPPDVFDGGTVAIFSCSESQRAFEHPDLKSGVFFHFINRAFSGEADTDNDQVIDLLELELFTIKNVQKWSRVNMGKSQIPERTGRTKGGMELFYLDRRSKTETLKNFTNSLGANMILIPAGVFTMGSPASDSNADSDEKPHRVTISRPYYLGETEVTQGQWKAVMKSEPWKGRDYVREGDNYPATYISWEDATEFCRRLSAKEGREYRLPTEAEWEYACRAGSNALYSFGGEPTNLSQYGWFEDNASNVGERYAHLVKQKRGNSFGLYDMHGNVFEWCFDWYGDYPASAVVDPVGPAEGSLRVIRGGCWHCGAAYCRSADRVRDDPSRRDDFNGFRVALSSSEIPQSPEAGK